MYVPLRDVGTPLRNLVCLCDPQHMNNRLNSFRYLPKQKKTQKKKHNNSSYRRTIRYGVGAAWITGREAYGTVRRTEISGESSALLSIGRKMNSTKLRGRNREDTAYCGTECSKSQRNSWAEMRIYFRRTMMCACVWKSTAGGRVGSVRGRKCDFEKWSRRKWRWEVEDLKGDG